MNKIIIIGGGPVGAVAAHLLAQHGLDVTVIDRPKIHRPESNIRNEYKAGETLPPVANSLLKQLSLYPLIQQGPHINCPGNQSAFGSRQLVDFDFIFTANGQGWHLDRKYFEQQLLHRAQKIGVKIIQANVNDIQFDGEQWQLQLENKTELEKSKTARFLIADYLIDASGAARYLLRQQNVSIKHHDKLAARIAVFKTDLAAKRDHRTLIEAQQNGWWYSTCTPNNTRLVMFFSDTNLTDFQLCNNKNEFLHQLSQTEFIQKKLQQECTDYTNISAMSFFTESARSSQASKVQGQQWFAIGDAAMSFDPLSSQGLWVGFQSAILVTQTILQEIPQSQYSQWAHSIYQDYLNEKKKYYAMEQRWQTDEFWCRRFEPALE